MYAWPRSYADNARRRILGSPESGYGYRRVWHVPRANAEMPRNAVPASAGRLPERAETLANGSPPGPWRPRASGRRSWSV
jgi:hypothetical protein